MGPRSNSVADGQWLGARRVNIVGQDLGDSASTTPSITNAKEWVYPLVAFA